MDISNQVRLISRLLIKGAVKQSLRCELIDRDESSERINDEYQIRLLALDGQGWVSGTGRNSRIETAWIKALMELGEALIVKRSELQSRAGLAGGFTTRAATARAKAECIERDAFLHHYQSGEPAQYLETVPMGDGITLDLFRLASALPGFETCLVWDRRFSNSDSKGLSFGTAAGSTLQQAKSEALREWAATREVLLKHASASRSTPAVATRALNPSNQKRLHLAACFDERNIARFNRCFSRDGVELPQRSTRDGRAENWVIQTFESPLYFARFVHASHPALKTLSFGRSEETTALEDYSTPLYHPFW